MSRKAANNGIQRLLERLARGAKLSGYERAALARDGVARATTAALKRLGWKGEAALERCLDAFPRAARFCPACTLRVDGGLLEAWLSLEELWRFYLPLCCLLGDCRRGDRRVLVGVAGPPGSGKSVFCALLERLLDEVCGEAGSAVTVSLDGFHYSNTSLDGRGLRSLKGTPETFDVEAFAGALDRLADCPSIGLPGYDRALHDPVAGRVRVEPHHRIALVEGNYLLVEQDGWQAVRPRLELALFLSMPLEGVRPAIVARHVRGGRSPEDAAAHFERVDRPDCELCMRTARRADILVERTSDQRIAAMRTRL